MSKSKSTNNLQKYTTLLSLYLAQSIPMTFFATVLPAIMRSEQYSLTAIGLIQLIKLPWILKFLWAPLIDKAQGRIVQYKKWIIGAELGYALIILGTAFLDIQTDFTLIIALLIIAFTASATQDIATDAFAILILKKEERSIGNGIQSAGSFLGTVTGSGVLLVIYHYWGWHYLLVALALFVLIALIPLLQYNGIKYPANKPSTGISFKDIGYFFKQKHIRKRILLLVFFYSGLIGTLTMLKPWMIDLGYSIKDIGLYSGVYGALAGAGTAVLTGFQMKRIGKKNTLYIILTYALIVSLFFWIISFTTPDYRLLQTAIIGIWSVYGMATVFIYTSSMDIVRQGREGTDFTIQIVLTHLGSLFLAVLSGKIAHNLGYTNLFLVEVILSVLVWLGIPYLYRNTKKQNYEI